MGNKRSFKWETDEEVYSPEQVEAVLNDLGIEPVSDTYTHFLCYCPFHYNNDSPAFAVDKARGLYVCFNPSCANAGTLEQLVSKRKHTNVFETRRIILKHKDATGGSVSTRIEQLLSKPTEFIEFPSVPVARMREDFWQYVKPMGYMHKRGFNDATLEYFDIGYSKKRDMVIVPMHDPKGMLVGFVGRSIEDKVFKNSDNLPKSKTMWNFHRAKREGDTVIICESSFDAMRIWQAGYKNVVALLGGHLSPYHIDQLNKTFSNIVIMTDFDKRQSAKPNCRQCAHRPPDEYGIRCIGHRPGRDLGHSIVNALPNKKILWAAYDDTCVYPHDAKDASDMTDDEIRHCLHGAVSNFAYVQWDIENADLAVAS